MTEDAASDIHIADPVLGEAEKRRIESVVESGRVADGPEVRAFEREFAAYCDVDHGVATANGTTALHAALEAVGIGAGDTVVTTPFSFVATANAVRLAGAEPAFVDVDPQTYNLDAAAVRRTVRETDADAILAVHLYGLPARMDTLATVADEAGIPLVEDAAQAHGARFDGRPVGSLGDVACFSFYPTKNMTTAEGGMVVTDDEALADATARFVNHGREEHGYRHVETGHNFRMTSIAAAIGRVQLERLPEFVERRRRNAALLDERLADVPVLTPLEPARRRHAYHQYTIQCGNRESVREALSDAGIGTGVYYPRCIHEQPAYDDCEASMPVAEHLADEVLSLPVHPSLSPEDVERVGETLADAVTVEPPTEPGAITTVGGRQ